MQLHPILGDVVFFLNKNWSSLVDWNQAMEQLSSNPEMLNQATQAMKNLSPEAGNGEAGVKRFGMDGFLSWLIYG